jgi:hypothetical protein
MIRMATREDDLDELAKTISRVRAGENVSSDRP